MLVPLALAQFVCSFAGSNMNVMISAISDDLDTTIHGVQLVITMFLLVMAALMIPGGKLCDRYGRVRMLRAGLVVYGVGALLSAAAPGLGLLIVGYSLLQGIGTAMLIPPVYILATLNFGSVADRARAFGVISAMGGVGAATGPLIGGLITSAICWRASFVFQALVVAAIVLLCRGLVDPLEADPHSRFDLGGAVLCALGLILLVGGVLALDQDAGAAVALMLLGAAVLLWFLLSMRAQERRGLRPLLSLALFRSRVSNLGLITQNIQWLILMGSSFTVSAYLQVVRGYGAVETGVTFTAATVGLLVSSLGAGRLARRRSQRSLIVMGFAIAVVGIAILVVVVRGTEGSWGFVPGLLLLGFGLGLMLTPSVNVVQSSFPEDRQSEISGLSRSVSNLGSSLGTAIAGTILAATLSNRAYSAAMFTLAGIGVLGLIAAVFLPRTAGQIPASDAPAPDLPASAGPAS